ncbi:hypothetical protein SAMN02745133_00337 [Desulforamulus putei DSM 12395]|uniref:Uncharacterized protein n=1 Tax=Desulforamulus putei DSM 12395 TaxID=1121429 RepID=A0A1M4T3K9_9FIRM|nr:hypothetical protein SAMN02745133_00337 [Desulforamulus putei DSM 12395]
MFFKRDNLNCIELLHRIVLSFANRDRFTIADQVILLKSFDQAFKDLVIDQESYFDYVIFTCCLLSFQQILCILVIWPLLIPPDFDTVKEK